MAVKKLISAVLNYWFHQQAADFNTWIFTPVAHRYANNPAGGNTGHVRGKKAQLRWNFPTNYWAFSQAAQRRSLAGGSEIHCLHSSVLKNLKGTNLLRQQAWPSLNRLHVRLAPYPLECPTNEFQSNSRSPRQLAEVARPNLNRVSRSKEINAESDIRHNNIKWEKRCEMYRYWIQ